MATSTASSSSSVPTKAPALSLLDLVPARRNDSPQQPFMNAVELAQAAERSGYETMYYAEHHNMGEIASTATAVLMGHVAARTETLGVGAAGVMLTNHAPLVVAEQFKMLEALYPGRIQLGLGRAPGTDQATVRALRRSPDAAEHFPSDVMELLGYLDGPSRIPGVEAYPATPDSTIPVTILGSSLYGAQLAAKLGLPYSFASHFAPTHLHEAIKVYREEFKPSERLEKPRVTVAAGVVAAPTASEANDQFQFALRRRVQSMLGRNRSQPFTEAEINQILQMPAGNQVRNMMSYSAVGTPDRVVEQLRQMAEETQADELILSYHAISHEDRLASVISTGEAWSK
ncbi:LLM class flavin-dependent oxidoreductase [Pseudoglutamicibacter cumminsii]|uniref:LLM class flavin-dependent oxidoreductase n=1 Tax=Pseudoglutamicibacter cumminsii TaxID=156979 RepID=UPI00195E8ED7|nr:LLM class flavin-dependent oxidoreductase [Pseudoglutamicibacter cumminsii]MBM7795691.1 luciferase family oxidoreductase group 1 [Pseudoglutamicibacter cumminsii]